MSYFLQTYQSPIGILYLVSDEIALRGVIFSNMWPQFRVQFLPIEQKETPVLALTKQQMTEYFQGTRKNFELAFHLEGTEFQKRVWTSLTQIPFGETCTYGQQAILLNSPRAARAVGRTNGLNPLCLVLPCHRVVGSNGSLTGYAGGLEIKKFLLELEKTA